MVVSQNKFSRVHDAAGYINSELRRRNLLQGQQKILFRSVDDDALQTQLASINNDKLLINTFHKLLRALDAAESHPSSKSPPSSTPSPPSRRPPREYSSPSVNSRTAPDRISKSRRQDLASSRRNEVLIEQLRGKLHRHSEDMTWKVAPIGEVARENGDEDASGILEAADHTSTMLQALFKSRDRMACALTGLNDFLQASNAFLYTKYVHGCDCQVPQPVDLSQSVSTIQTDPSDTIQHLQELVNDWHDIANLLERHM
ncbi:LAFE_0C07734g1_1 [Lachancea fermentati]|uniref:LAFE_0C07734g1_1 n=1 Tax=Lachancea fermentati TaxID=4955 RepID=A0A1G4MA61_LACFM|nr:LAFE_0C07734g1_1 [Lachancea fermentati]